MNGLLSYNKLIQECPANEKKINPKKVQRNMYILITEHTLAMLDMADNDKNITFNIHLQQGLMDGSRLTMTASTYCNNHIAAAVTT